MLLDALLAAPTPDTEVITAYDWWRDIVLPGIVGVAGLALTAVTIRVASRSNKFAAAATAAAERSNTIAERVAAQEEARAAEAREQRSREDRREFGNRFLVAIDRLVSELTADPALWSQKIDEVGDNALYDLGPLLFEATARGWTDLPSDAAVQTVRSGAKAGGG
ncbi:hypothetical protein IAE22_29115, partial [Bacillus sp. S34]|nr:hypothetical protein [Bacillus sp. S34]